MPKIPTFTSQVAPTAEVGAVKSNIQISPKSSLAGALLPAADAVTQFYIKEKEISNKVEGGELIANANQELLELKEQSKLLRNISLLIKLSSILLLTKFLYRLGKSLIFKTLANL